MHLSDDEMEWYLAGRLSPSQSSTVSSHLSACNVCASELRRLSEQDREESDRSVRIRVIGASITPRLLGRIIEECEGRLKLTLSQPLEPGSLVQIRIDSRFILAEVRYCSRQGDEFHASIETKDVFQMPPKK
jgi:hypothetical protein